MPQIIHSTTGESQENYSSKLEQGIIHGLTSTTNIAGIFLRASNHPQTFSSRCLYFICICTVTPVRLVSLGLIALWQKRLKTPNPPFQVSHDRRDLIDQRPWHFPQRTMPTLTPTMSTNEVSWPRPIYTPMMIPPPPIPIPLLPNPRPPSATTSRIKCRH